MKLFLVDVVVTTSLSTGLYRMMAVISNGETFPLSKWSSSLQHDDHQAFVQLAEGLSSRFNGTPIRRWHRKPNCYKKLLTLVCILKTREVPEMAFINQEPVLLTENMVYDEHENYTKEH